MPAPLEMFACNAYVIAGVEAHATTGPSESWVLEPSHNLLTAPEGDAWKALLGNAHLQARSAHHTFLSWRFNEMIPLTLTIPGHQC